MSKQAPKVPIENMKLVENYYQDHNGNNWSAVKLIEASKGLPVFEVPVASISLNTNAWSIASLQDFIHHVGRVRDTNLDYPIIYDDEGIICDGLHRVCKAILLGHTTIKAVRLTEMPPMDSTEERNKS